MFAQRIVFELLGIKFPQFSHFCLFSVTKRLKIYPCDKPTAQGYIQNVSGNFMQQWKMQRVPFASGGFPATCGRELLTSKFAQIFAYGKCLFIHTALLHSTYTQCYYTEQPIQTKHDSKRVILQKDVPFGGMKDVPLKFGEPNPQNGGPPMKVFKVCTTRNSNTYNFNAAMPITTKLSHRIAAVNWPLWVIP